MAKKNKTSKQIPVDLPAYIEPETIETIKHVENSTLIQEEDELSKTNKNKKILLGALEKSLGVVTTACKAVNLSRTQHYTWMETDPEYKAEVERLNDMVIDFAESKLHTLINNGDTAATIFYLKTKGKKRGYIERVENMIGEVEQPLFGPENE